MEETKHTPQHTIKMEETDIKMEDIEQAPKMKILFLTTAHNSLSQRLFLVLEATGKYDISIEYAISEAVMIEAFELFQPDLIICPFLTSKVPAEIYTKVMTLIIHPGPPGDAGPSALDWLLMGDDGSEEDSVQQLIKLNTESEKDSHPRTAWGVSVIQATEKFDAGPIWAAETFNINIDEIGLTKSSLYRGPITRAAITATTIAVDRLVAAKALAKPLVASARTRTTVPEPPLRISPTMVLLNAGDISFSVPNTKTRPLLKAAERDFDVNRHTAKQISRRIRSGDSQPGVQSKVFGSPAVYIYGGMIDDLDSVTEHTKNNCKPGQVVMTREEAVCIYTCDKKGVWITHIRRLKRKIDKALWPKVPAATGLIELGHLMKSAVNVLNVDFDAGDSAFNRWGIPDYKTYQDVWIDLDIEDDKRIAYVYFDFYNGAMSTRQCKRLLNAIQCAADRCCAKSGGIRALVLMGGSYFSNGIALNVIEASSDPAQESWENINAIDDIVQLILELSRNHVITVAGVRGNAAAGGVALMAACDYVVCGREVVLNPAYRAIGLSGSEFHTMSYHARCKDKANELLRTMLPISPDTAQSWGLVDYVVPEPGALPATSAELDTLIREHVRSTLGSIPETPEYLRAHNTARTAGPTFWTDAGSFTSSQMVQHTREVELQQMSLDFWGPRSQRYHSRRFNFVRKEKPQKTPLRFAKHRRGRGMLDLEEKDEFDSVMYWKQVKDSGSSSTGEVKSKVKTSGVQVLVTEISRKGSEDDGLCSLLGQASAVDDQGDVVVRTRGHDEAKVGGIEAVEEAAEALANLDFAKESGEGEAQESGHQFTCYYDNN